MRVAFPADGPVRRPNAQGLESLRRLLRVPGAFQRASSGCPLGKDSAVAFASGRREWPAEARRRQGNYVPGPPDAPERVSAPTAGIWRAFGRNIPTVRCFGGSWGVFSDATGGSRHLLEATVRLLRELVRATAPCRCRSRESVHADFRRRSSSSAWNQSSSDEPSGRPRASQ